MRHTVFAILLILLSHTSCSGIPANVSIEQEQMRIDTLWQKEFNSAQEIIANFNGIRQLLKGKPQAVHTENLCHYIWQSGEYMFRCRGKNEDIYGLPERSTELSFDNAVVAQFASTKKIGRFADH